MSRSPLPSDLQLAKAAALFSALASEPRLRALVALSRRGPMAVSDLLPLCGLEQSALSHQLGILRSAGLVAADRRGRRIFYALADDHVRRLVDDGLAHAGESTAQHQSQE